MNQGNDHATEFLKIKNPIDFERLAIYTFRNQYHKNEVYQRYVRHLGISYDQVQKTYHIPFLPIEFFKTHTIKTGQWSEEKTFLSSGTTQAGQRSQHHVRHLDQYLQVAQRAFASRFGNFTDLEFFALLPSYQEQGSSSLIAMVDYFMSLTGRPQRYYINNLEQLTADLNACTHKPILWGIPYALLDYAETMPTLRTNDLIIIETGGMKGRRREMVREELHWELKKSLGDVQIHSEYGMTELLSQGYSQKGLFHFPPWAMAMARDVNDPFHFIDHGRTGALNIIDLANQDSCAFIETKDLGKVYADGSFEVLGRMDNSDIRGCNLLT